MLYICAHELLYTQRYQDWTPLPLRPPPFPFPSPHSSSELKGQSFAFNSNGPELRLRWKNANSGTAMMNKNLLGGQLFNMSSSCKSWDG